MKACQPCPTCSHAMVTSDYARLTRQDYAANVRPAGQCGQCNCGESYISRPYRDLGYGPQLLEQGGHWYQGNTRPAYVQSGMPRKEIITR